MEERRLETAHRKMTLQQVVIPGQMRLSAPWLNLLQSKGRIANGERHSVHLANTKGPNLANQTKSCGATSVVQRKLHLRHEAWWRKEVLSSERCPKSKTHESNPNPTKFRQAPRPVAPVARATRHPRCT